MTSGDPIIPISIEPVRGAADVARCGEPVTFGVPFPAGAVREGDLWSLMDAAGRPASVQTRALNRWPDGSVRWMLVDGRVDVDGAQTYHLARTPRAAAAACIRVERAELALIVDTGAARFEFRRSGGFPLHDVIVDGSGRLDPAMTAFEAVDATGAAHRVVVRRATVAEEGPLRCTVEVEGSVQSSSTLPLELFARVDFYAGLPTARVAVRVRNPQRAQHPGGFWDLGDAGSILLKDVSWTIGLVCARRAASTIRCSPEPESAWQDHPAPFELYQDSSGGENWRSTAHLNRQRRVPNAFRGYRIGSAAGRSAGLRATPIASVQSDMGSVTLAVPQFWQNFPKAIEAAGSALTLRLFPRQYDDVHEIQGGEQKTHVCFVAFGEDGVTEAPLEWCRARVRTRVDAEWILASGAIPWLAPDDPDHAALVRSAVAGDDTFEHKREVVDEYGWRNFGDVYGDHEAIRHQGPMPLVSHYNNQYDPIAGFLYEYLRGGDPAWWSMADDLAAHVVDIDVYHTTRDKWAYNHGLFWHTYHYGDADTSTHRTYPRACDGTVSGGGPSPDHNYTTGLMLHYFLTGNPDSKQTVEDLGQFVIDADDGRKTVFRWLSGARTGFATASGSYDYHGPGRGPANSLNALVDSHRVSGEPRFLEKAEELIRRVVHPHDAVERHRLDDPENKWFYLMFLQSLGKYLWYKVELRQRDGMYAYGRSALLRYARWMADHEYPYLERPERLTFPTETWAAHEVRKTDVFYHAALHADGVERKRFEERARFFFRYAVDTLNRMPTKTKARPVIVLLSSGLMKPWYESRPGVALPPPDREQDDFGDPVSFVPQKRQAMQRAKVLAASGGAALVMLLLLVVYWLA
jgi:hypothetical protein